MVRCAVWYHLRNLKNVKNTHGGVLILVKLQTLACRLLQTLKLYKWYQIAQRITYLDKQFGVILIATQVLLLAQEVKML